MCTCRKDVVLAAALDCTNSCRLLCDARSTVHRYVVDYEPLIDKALCAQLELLHGLMTEFVAADSTDRDAGFEVDVGPEPTTYSEAIAKLGDFLNLAQHVIRVAATTPATLAATAIGERAFTFACLIARLLDE